MLDEIGRLASDTTEMGIVVGDMFRYASAALFGQEPEAARFAMESRAWVTRAATTLDRRVRAIIQQFDPTGNDLRRIVELQHAVSQYGRIADRSNHIAETALALGGSCDDLLRRVAADAPEFLYALIALVYEQMHGVFLVTAARDGAEARAIVARDAEVVAYYNAVRMRLESSIKSTPQFALHLLRVVMITTDMRQIGEAVVTICQATF
jgi:phosphate uptake regulator